MFSLGFPCVYLYVFSTEKMDVSSGSIYKDIYGVRSVLSVMLWEHTSEHLGTHGGNC